MNLAPERGQHLLVGDLADAVVREAIAGPVGDEQVVAALEALQGAQYAEAVAAGEGDEIFPGEAVPENRG